MERTNPRLNMPPGSFSHSSFSSASRKREPIRVAVVTSFSETSRNSRSRFSRSPKFPLAMNRNLSSAFHAGRPCDRTPSRSLVSWLRRSPVLAVGRASGCFGGRCQNPLHGTIEGVARHCQTNRFFARGAASRCVFHRIFSASPPPGILAGTFRPQTMPHYSTPGLPVPPDGKIATPVPRHSCAPFCHAPILTKIRGTSPESLSWCSLPRRRWSGLLNFQTRD